MERLTIVLGASEKPDRYSNMAARRLMAYGHAVLCIGRRPGRIGELPIRTEIPEGTRAHTVTMYLSAANQSEWRERLLALKPKRVIFNPGAENPVLARELEGVGTEAVEACTLVLLATGEY
ncbi:MAG: CoA-binding protein [Flavobacteriales bacterium]|jgi:hypothetical protein|nr:CoA-binding protein [Flavobacteriales bacterium]